jgi:MATE family multidrug resistance protein
MTGLRKELRPMVRLAAPLAIAELGWMTMGFVDTIMAGRIDAISIGAGGVGHMLFFPIVVSATGLLLGMDTLVSHAFGAKQDDDCRHTLISGLWLSLFISPLTVALFLGTIPLLRAFDTNPEVMAVLTPYLQALSLYGIPPLSAGARHRPAHHLRGGQRKRDQFRRQLAADVRQLGRAAPRAGGLRDFDGPFARLYRNGPGDRAAPG